MAITGITGLNTTQAQLGIKNADAKLQAAIASIVSGTKDSDVANVAIASQLQSQTAGLKQVSNNLAQGFSLTQVADSGAQQISSALSQLRNLAQQAQSPTLNNDTRTHLDKQFKALAFQIDQIATDTSFNNKPLLDGSLSGANALSLDSLLASPDTGGSALSIPSLTAGSLLGSSSLGSANGVDQVLAAVGTALDTVTGARAGIGAFQQTLDFASANVETAVLNQEAAFASLAETDLSDASAQSSQADVKANAAIALLAQGNRLSPSLIKLVG